MAKLLFLLLLSASYILSWELTVATATRTAMAAKTSKRALNFIKLSCKSTTYSDVCVKFLTPYANTIQTSPQRLVKTALVVTVKYAKSTNIIISHLRRNSQFRTLQDCAPDPSVFTTDSLTKAVQELKISDSASGQSQFLFHMSKAQALITSASDDFDVENTCSGRFSVKMNSVKVRLVNLRKETSNVISLFNAFAKN